MSGMPPWLLARLETTTGMDVRRGMRLRAGLCPTCRGAVLEAWDDDVMAFYVRIQPDPIDQTGELLAVIQNRPTYDLTPAQPGLRLQPRTSSHMKRPRTRPVVARHDCTRPLPTDPTPPTTSTPSLPPGSPCPF